MTPGAKVQITKRLINNKIKEKVENIPQEITWDETKQTNFNHEDYFNKFISLYGKIW